MKPVWSVEIQLGMKGRMRLAITLANNLMSVFIKEIGLKLLQRVGSLPGLGITVICAERDSGRKPVVWEIELAYAVRRGSRIS